MPRSQPPAKPFLNQINASGLRHDHWPAPRDPRMMIQ